MSFQLEVGRWAEIAFPQATDRSIVAHLRREAVELEEAAAIDWPSPVERSFELGQEAADVYLLLLHLAHRHGFSLEQFARAKFDKNVRRRWGRLDAEGVVEHLREGE